MSATSALHALSTYPLGKPGKLIGTPYQGTHSKATNVPAGSDNWESENAIDIGVPVGTPVRAVSDGKIGSQLGSLGIGGRFAGQRLHLLAGTNEYYYAHLSRITVRPGQLVKAGDLLGFSGSANGVAHLHFAAKIGNPENLLGLGGGGSRSTLSKIVNAPGDLGKSVAHDINQALGLGDPDPSQSVGERVQQSGEDTGGYIQKQVANAIKDVFSGFFDSVKDSAPRALLFLLLTVGGLALAGYGTARLFGVQQPVKSTIGLARKAAIAGAVA